MKVWGQTVWLPLPRARVLHRSWEWGAGPHVRDPAGAGAASTPGEAPRSPPAPSKAVPEAGCTPLPLSHRHRRCCARNGSRTPGARTRALVVPGPP